MDFLDDFNGKKISIDVSNSSIFSDEKKDLKTSIKRILSDIQKYIKETRIHSEIEESLLVEAVDNRRYSFSRIDYNIDFERKIFYEITEDVIYTYRIQNQYIIKNILNKVSAFSKNIDRIILKRINYN
jgi:hypothetical protein